jgi:hypothetical protein
VSAPSNICPQCGAPARGFPPEATSYTCHFCETVYAVEDPDPKARARAKKKADHERRLAENRAREEREEQRRKEKEEKEARKEKAKAKEDRSAAIFGVAVTASIVLFSVAGPWYYEAVWRPAHWSGHDSHRCSKGDVTFTDLQATATLTVDGTCHVTLVRPNFEATIRASDHAVVVVKGGRLHNTSTVVTASGFANVTLDGATVEAARPTGVAVEARGGAMVQSLGAVVHGVVRSDSPGELVGFAPAPASSKARARGAGRSARCRRSAPS